MAGVLPCMMLKVGRRPSTKQKSKLDLTNRRKGRRVLTFVGPLPSAERPIYWCGVYMPVQTRDYLPRLAFRKNLVRRESERI